LISGSLATTARAGTRRNGWTFMSSNRRSRFWFQHSSKGEVVLLVLLAAYLVWLLALAFR
jgi:hypothetical protein